MLKTVLSLAPFLSIFLLNPLMLYSQIDHWESIFIAESIWKYTAGDPNIPNNWRTATFDDSTWQEGLGGIGYGDGDDNTQFNPGISLYLRKSFNIIDIDHIENLVFHADYDDGFVAYINGQEVARGNLAQDFPPYNELAEEHEADLYQGQYPDEYIIPITALNTGENIIAIQVHNTTINSSDMSSNFYLSAGINNTDQNYQPIPNWFNPPIEINFQSSNLPIIKINTLGQVIVDDPDIQADFGIIYNGPGNTNFVDDPMNEYFGKINIEIRGESSQFFFDKKSYGIETIDEFGVDMDTSFLNFPTEEDWILYGPFSDKTLLRNALTMHLGNSMGQYASRTRFCEVMINNSYQGIYLIMEKIKRDENRVDIANLKEEDIDGVELTGGYIYRKDKGDNHWNSQYGIGYQFVYPKIEDVQGEQFAYLQTYVDSFEIAVGHPSYSYAGKRYDEYIDLNSFVETFILNELSKNADGYRLSSYFYKEKDSAGGKIFAGPFWDFNLSFRNANYCEAFQTFGWMYSNNSGCSVENPFWWERMVQDEIFTTALRCRYQELRQSSFQLDSIFEYIDEKAALLEGAQERNFEKYDILGQYIWPNPEPFASSYLEEIQQLKNWINNRLNWMDSNMFGECPPTSTTKIAEDFDFELSPNPFSNNLILQINRTSIEPLEIKIQNIQGQVFYQQKINHMENSLQIIIPGIQLTNGIYFACVTSGGSHMIKKVIKVE